jgi:hypothetical protein
MDQNVATGLVGARVSAALRVAGVSVRTLSEATDIPISELESRLSGDTDFTISELVSVGGFLRSPANTFLEGVA